MVHGGSTLIPAQPRPEGTVTIGPVLSRKLSHLELNDPTVRELVKNFLEKESANWDRALDVSRPFSDLEKAWTELFDELRSSCDLDFTWLAAMDPRYIRAKVPNRAAKVTVDLGIFRRMYYDYALSFPCVQVCADVLRDRCGDALRELMDRRFEELPGMDGTSYPDSTWQELRGLNFRAFALLYCMQTVLFLADIVRSQAGQERASIVLGTCQDRLLHMVNTGVDEVARNAKKLYVVSSS